MSLANAVVSAYELRFHMWDYNTKESKNILHSLWVFVFCCQPFLQFCLLQPSIYLPSVQTLKRQTLDIILKPDSLEMFKLTLDIK